MSLSSFAYELKPSPQGSPKIHVTEEVIEGQPRRAWRAPGKSCNTTLDTDVPYNGPAPLWGGTCDATASQLSHSTGACAKIEGFYASKAVVATATRFLAGDLEGFGYQRWKAPGARGATW